MTYQEIHALVAHGQNLPPFQSLPDRLCYECLHKLKEKYEADGGDKKRLRNGKQDVRRAHEEYTEAFLQYMATYKEYSDNCIKTGQDMKTILDAVRSEAPDYKTLFIMAVNCIGRMQHDEVTIRLIKESVQP